MSMMNFSDKYSFFDSSRVSKGWAGPSHWKIHRSNSSEYFCSKNFLRTYPLYIHVNLVFFRNPFLLFFEFSSVFFFSWLDIEFTYVSSNAEPKRKRPSRLSSNESIDFLSGHSESMDSLLRSVPISTTTLSSIKEENRHILPEDLQLTIDDLTSLCLVPRSKVFSMYS